MVLSGYEWWTDERVDATVTKHFIYSHLPADEAERLTTPIFADLSDNTYLECILAKAKRLFLILNHLGVPGDILRLIEDSYDDENLPIDVDDVTSLTLSRVRGQQIDAQFYRTQFKFLARVVGEGEHIRYADVEQIPLQKVDQKFVTSHHALEKVQLPSPVNKVFLLKRIYLRDDSIEYDILSEIASTKALSHEHIWSVFGSYVQDNYMHILMTPAAKFNLAQFMQDQPKSFEALPKFERRSHWVIWPHCLASALAWLHARGVHHGAIRPSCILIDDQFHISLGHFEGDWILGHATQKDDLESYQYAAPELWKRSLTLQAQTSSGIGSFYGGRSALGRRDVLRQHEQSSMPGGAYETSQPRTFDTIGERAYTFVPRSKGVSSRLRLEISANGSSPLSSAPKRSVSRRQDGVDSPIDSVRRNHGLYRRYGSGSIRSSNSSENHPDSRTSQSERLYPIASETKKTAVQAWKSTANDFPATDVFGLAAITMDMLTVLCSRTVSAFAKHRGSKNRQAGRGGGLADSSFHANLTQVGTWAEHLHKDADKKLKKNSSDIFRVVGPILQVIMQCLDREPEKRASAASFARRLERYLVDIEGLKQLHCLPPAPEDHHIRSQSTVTILPNRAKTPVLPRIDDSHEKSPSPDFDALERKSQVDSMTASKASGSSMRPLTPADSYVSATYYQKPLPQPNVYIRSHQADSYSLHSDDYHRPDSYYVQVMPKDRTTTRRFLKDFTEHDPLSSRATSIAPSFTTANHSHLHNHVLSPTAIETSHGSRAAKSNLSSLPLASAPPNRKLPASPTGTPRARVKWQPSDRYSTSPLDNVSQANDLLAVALRDMSVEDRLSFAASTSGYPIFDDEEKGTNFQRAK